MKNDNIFICTFQHPFMPFEFSKLFHSAKPQGRKMIHAVSLPLWPFIIFLTITLMSLRVPTCLCADDAQFLNCSSPIQCGDLQNISYPFWGSNRPSYCGLGDEFQLTCEDNTALLTLGNLKYRLLSYDNTTKRVTVARNDYWNNLCPSTLYNSSDPSPFTYTSDTVASNLTFYYGCQATTVPTIIPVTSQLNCTINNSTIIGYFLTKNVSDITNFGSVDLTTVLRYYGACQTSVVVPAYASAVQSIESSPLNSTVVTALEQGFGLQWTDTNCAGCAGSGGQCGRNESSNDFVCYCSGGPTSSTCSGSGIVFRILLSIAFVLFA